MATNVQAQTPQQRQANMRFAKAQEKKMGKPESTEPVVKKRAPQKSPISRFWISTFFPPYSLYLLGLVRNCTD